MTCGMAAIRAAMRAARQRLPPSQGATGAAGSTGAIPVLGV
ncbi:hypothetical protein [Ruegeria sp.]